MNEESLFAAALEKSIAERPAFLDAACGGDRLLRDRVERLLAADECNRGILDQGPAAAALLAGCQPHTPHPARFGELPRVIKEADPPGYELSEEVGEGGMGVVYRARDTDLGRDVAVKVLHPRFAADGPAARRFLGEARVTAQLQHPGVPPVHQVGALPDGRPFLVMKLIRGRTLTDLLAEEQADRGRLLAAFEQVCQAVAYAHDRGVIHRDLKPGNVMVGAFGEVQVMDWGLAKVLAPATGPGEPTAGDETTVDASAIDPDRQAGDGTRTGSVLGTPAYMPPEQAIGAVNQVDERSDVFGLGAILCAVLIGRPPYVGTDAESTRQLAARAKLGDAFARLDGCGAEPGLVELCKRCLSPEQADRPADAGEVARAVAGLRAAADERARVAELDRVRAEGERAKAEAETREQRKRRRVQAGLGMTLTAAVALVGFGLWWNERQKSAAAADRASRQSRTAASVSAALDDARARIGEAWAVADEPDKMRAVTDLALAAVRRAEGFADSGEPTPDTLDGLAAVRADAADLDRHTRLFVAADQAMKDQGIGSDGNIDRVRTSNQLGEAFRQFGWDLARTPAADIVAAVAASRVRNKVLGVLCDRSFRSAQDPALRGKILEVIRGVRLRSGGLLAEWQRAADAGDWSRLKEFAARPDVLTLGPELLYALGRDLFIAPDTSLALLDLTRRAVDRYPTHVWLNELRAVACQNVTPRRRAEALRAAAVAAAARPDSARLQADLGGCFAGIGDTDQAIACLRKAIALAPSFGFAYQDAYAVFAQAGDREGALTAYREFARQTPDPALAHYYLGVGLLGLGPQNKSDPDGAVPQLREAVRLAGQGGRAARGQMGKRLGEAADRLETQRKWAEAVIACREAAAALEPVLAEDPAGADAAAVRENLAGVLGRHGSILSRLGRHPEAIEPYRKSLVLWSELRATDPNRELFHQLHASYTTQLADALRAARRPEEAEAAAREALRLYQELVARSPANESYQALLGDAYHTLARALEALDRRAEAIRVVEHAWRTTEAGGPDAPAALGTGTWLAQLYRADGRPADALVVLDDVLRRLKPGDRSRRDRFFALVERAWAYDDLGRHAEAAEDWAEVVALAAVRAQVEYRTRRATSLVRAGHVEAGVREGDELARGGDANALFNAARVRAVAAGRPNPADDPEAADRHARRAIELLRQAVAKGFKNVRLAAEEDDLDALRDRPDFRAMLRELGQAAPADYPGALAALGAKLLDRRKYVAAEPVLRDCLAARKETLPDWTTASARSMLGGALLEQGKYGDAEPLLRAGCEGLKKWAWKTPPAEKVRLPEAAGRLARLYAAIGYPEEAAKWRAEAAKYPETAPPPRPADR